jgi:hypothetical protein
VLHVFSIVCSLTLDSFTVQFTIPAICRKFDFLLTVVSLRYCMKYEDSSVGNATRYGLRSGNRIPVGGGGGRDYKHFYRPAMGRT